MSRARSDRITGSSRFGDIPPLIRLFVVADLLLIVLYVIDTAAERPFGRFFDLDQEVNLPTAIASLQLLVVGALSGLFALEHFDRNRPRSWLLWGLPLLFLVLATDEAIGIHEKTGLRIDEIVPAVDREHLVFDETGIWMFFIGVPFIAITVSFVYFMRGYFNSPQLISRAALGFGIFMGGAVGAKRCRISSRLTRSDIQSRFSPKKEPN